VLNAKEVQCRIQECSERGCGSIGEENKATPSRLLDSTDADHRQSLRQKALRARDRDPTMVMYLSHHRRGRSAHPGSSTVRHRLGTESKAAR
jgi:hypothetical protein